eukprot:scaffold120285_cov65-Phaeocystis_antarctica.AAC.2
MLGWEERAPRPVQSPCAQRWRSVCAPSTCRQLCLLLCSEGGLTVTPVTTTAVARNRARERNFRVAAARAFGLLQCTSGCVR